MFRKLVSFLLVFCCWTSFAPAQTAGGPLPDLVAEKFGIDTDKPMEGQGIAFVITIKNQGTAPTPPDSALTVTFSIVPSASSGQKPERLFWTTFRNTVLAPGESREFRSAPNWLPDPGNYVVEAKLNDVRRIQESDYTNNTIDSDSITVVPNPDLQAALGPAEPSTYTPSPNEAILNGNIPSLDAKPLFEQDHAEEVVAVDGINAIRMDHSFILAAPAPEQLVAGADYVFSYRAKAVKVGPDGATDKIMGAFLWLQYPSLPEPPKQGGYQPSGGWSGTFNWKHFETKFRMPLGISRYRIFFDNKAGQGKSYLTDLSLRPVEDVDMKMAPGLPMLGAGDREQLVWIWSDPVFPWQGDFPNQSGNMGVDVNKAVPRKEVWFRRVLSVPPGITDAKAVFAGDDSASLEVNDQVVGGNASIQDIAQVPLDKILKPGDNKIVFKVLNRFGPGGLLGRIQWKTSQGEQVFYPTNNHWECSSDKGVSWTTAARVAPPVPTPTLFNWAYAHLHKNSYDLDTAIPAGTTAIRVAAISPGSFRVLIDKQDRGCVLCASRFRQIEFQDLKDPHDLTVSFEDITQPAAGNGTVAFKVNGSWQVTPLSSFTHAGQPPRPVDVFSFAKSWPINVGSFEAAADRPPHNVQMHLDPWAKDLLNGATPIFELGKRGETTSNEFAPLMNSRDKIDLSQSALVQTADLAQVPKGLETTLRPDFTINFHLDEVPPNGAAFVVGLEDADVIVANLGIFANGVFSGMPQVLGYNRVPGGHWLANRVLVVTLPKERLKAGTNMLTLRLLPTFYPMGGEANQAEEYIKMMGLGDNAKNPYKGVWLHWTALTLYALGKPTANPINGHPAWMGVNSGPPNADPTLQEYNLRDLSYLGLVGTDAPYRYGVWDEGYLKTLNQTDPSYPDGKTLGDIKFGSLIEKGMKPFILSEPGRNLPMFDPNRLSESVDAKTVQRYGQYFDTLETGNEVDHPLYGWDALPLSYAFGRIQMAAAVGQMLKQTSPNKKMQIIGQGWYFAWDFSVIDAQARQEAPEDLSWTDGLDAHNYGKSYIIEAVGYYLLYGVNLPKPLWITECGAWSSDINDANAFDADIRGDLAFATNIVVYIPHPYDADSLHFSLFSDGGKEAHILERCDSYRRLIHTFGLHGTPLPWSYADDAAMKDKLVFINPVDAGKWLKISFVNYEHEKVPIDLAVSLPMTGPLKATRYGGGDTVAQATREVTLQGGPKTHFQEDLGPGETVEYLIDKETATK